MLTLFQHRRELAARAPPQDVRHGRHRLNEDTPSPWTEEEHERDLEDAEDTNEEPSRASTAATTALQATTAARELTLLHASPPPPPRRRRKRHRSRNCQNFKRYGAFFQFTDPSLLDETEPGASALAQRPRGRRSLRGYDRVLAEELMDVQRRVLELERQRDLLHSAMINAQLNAVGHAVDTVKQFYVLFANGYDPGKCPQQSRRTEAFMRAVMDEDVVCTEFKGVDLFLNQYQVSSEMHASLTLALRDISVVNDDESGTGMIQVKARAVCTLRIKRETLARFFPSIIADEVLTQQLIGKEYVLQYDKVFHFQRGVVFQHESRIDFCNGILDMVKDPFVAMKLLEASLMTKHGHLKVDHRIEEDSHTLANSVL